MSRASKGQSSWLPFKKWKEKLMREGRWVAKKGAASVKRRLRSETDELQKVVQDAVRKALKGVR